MKSFRQFHEDAVAVNCAGGGQIAGIGVGASGEPGVKKKKKKQPVLGTVRRNTDGKN